MDLIYKMYIQRMQAAAKRAEEYRVSMYHASLLQQKCLGWPV